MSDNESSIPLHIRSFDVETRSAEFIASTDAVDSYGDSVEQSWKLDRYKSNPVVLYAHNAKELPIGQSERVTLDDGALTCRIKFASKAANPRAEEVFNCVKEGVLRAVSVGFVPGKVSLEKRSGKEVYVLSDNTLHEISVVPIPANHEALAKMRAKAREEFSTMNTDTSPAPQGAGKPGAPDAELASVRKQLSDVSAERDAFLAERSALVTERDRLATENLALSAKATLEETRAKTAEQALIEREVAALENKISPPEREVLLELAATNRSLFEKSFAIAKAKPDLSVFRSNILGADPTRQEPSSGHDIDGAGLAALANKTFKADSFLQESAPLPTERRSLFPKLIPTTKP